MIKYILQLQKKGFYNITLNKGKPLKRSYSINTKIVLHRVLDKP